MIETLCMDFVETNIWFERISLDINLHIASVFPKWKIILKTSKFWEKKTHKIALPHVYSILSGEYAYWDQNDLYIS